MNNKISFIIFSIAIFILGYHLGTLNQKNYPIPHNTNNEVQYVKKQDSNNKLNKQFAIDEATKVKISTPQKVADFSQLDKIFYEKLQNCEPLNVATKNGYNAYIIEGIKGNNCHFTHKQVGFMDTRCILPMNITKQYAKEGLDEVFQLEELKRQNKSGFVQSSEYISSINNDKNYCKFEYYQRK